MRTTLNIDDQVLAFAKHRAVEQGVTLTRVVENALRKKRRKNFRNSFAYGKWVRG
jgi:Family of unknown function (DUF6364)